MLKGQCHKESVKCHFRPKYLTVNWFYVFTILLSKSYNFSNWHSHYINPVADFSRLRMEFDVLPEITYSSV